MALKIGANKDKKTGIKSATSNGTASGGGTSSGSTSTTSNTTTTTPTSTGATYKVNADGKAPTGLSVGDYVVTGKGTYKIDGVNADGTYKSSLANDTTTYNYTGTYANATPTSTTASNTTVNNTPTNTGAYTGTVAGSDNVDYSTLALQKMAAGASREEIQNLYNLRLNKAISTPGLEKYANDDIMRQMLDYINAGFDEDKPTYDSQYDPAIKELVNQILNREDFSYNAENDPLYQQYAAIYRREGDRAMRDTMAEAAASAGGMNSYAITAAQQANNNYMAQLNDKIPELYQLAYEMYLQDKESKMQDLGILQSLDATDYNRYRDTMSDFYADKNFAYNQFINDRNFTYGAAQDYVTNQWRDKEWANTLEQQAIQNERWDKEWANALEQQAIQNERWDKEWNRDEERYQSGLTREDALMAKQDAQTQAFALLELGQIPPAELLAAAGIDPVYASAYATGIKQQMAAKASSSSSKKSKLYDFLYNGDDILDDDDDEDDDDEDDDYKSQLDDGSLLGLGIGPVEDDVYTSLASVGALKMDENGGVYWADGWNRYNWEAELTKRMPPHMIGLPGFTW